MNPWHAISGIPVPMSQSFGLMGIINLAPDSFFEHCDREEEAVEKAGVLLGCGADIIDLGAESTRPGAAPLEPVEEWGRLSPVLERIRQVCPDATLSVDTRNASTASLALQAGCAIINDVSACRHDPGLIDVLAQFKPGYVLMHARGEPQTMQIAPAYANVVAEIMAFFEHWLKRLTAAGLPENRIVLDPGIGFGKTLDHNLAILAHLEDFLGFGRPLLLGISMKGLFGKLLGLGPNERGEATAIASALLFAKGATWHRVHEVKRVRTALSLAQALKAGYGGLATDIPV